MQVNVAQAHVCGFFVGFSFFETLDPSVGQIHRKFLTEFTDAGKRCGGACVRGACGES